MANSRYDYLFKIVVVGDSSTGKSCMLARFVDGSFCQRYISTIGIDFKLKKITCDDAKIVKLQVWDTAGQERFRVITNSYYRGAGIIFIVFDLNNRESFDNVITWYKEITQYTFDNTVIVLVGCKSDLKWTVTKDEIQALSNTLNIKWYTCSALNDVGVTEIFKSVVNESIDVIINKNITKSENIQDPNHVQESLLCCTIQ